VSNALPSQWLLHFVFYSTLPQYFCMFTSGRGTMAGPSKFYSETEADALEWILKHFASPRSTKSQQSSREDEEFLQCLQERPLFSACRGRSLEQPLLKHYPLLHPQQPTSDLTRGSEEPALPAAPDLHIHDVHYIASSEDDNTVSARETAEANNAGPSKRAALIAKANTNSNRAISHPGVLTAMSASQKRAARRRNKHRKSAYEISVSKFDTEEPKLEMTKLAVTEEDVLDCENTPEARRTAVVLAIRQGCINADNDNQVVNLMRMLAGTPNTEVELDKSTQASEAVTKEISEDNEIEIAENSGNVLATIKERGPG
jgi:hypothetical protein